MSVCTYRESNSQHKDDGIKEFTSVPPGRSEFKITLKHFVYRQQGVHVRRALEAGVSDQDFARTTNDTTQAKPNPNPITRAFGSRR